MLLDSSAWIELLKKSNKGIIVKGIIETSQTYTSIVSLAEISNWCEKNNLDPEYYVKVIEKNSRVLNLKREVVILAGKINAVRKKKVHNWGMIDSLIYSTALIYDLKVLTKDHHFSGLHNVAFF